MTTPYTLHFNVSDIKETTLDTKSLSKWSNYPLYFSQSNHFYYTKNFEILRQIFNYKPFFVDLVEIHTEKPLDFMFEIHNKQLFMFFMLKGQMNFYDNSHRMIVQPLENNFLMSYYNSNFYHVEVNKGSHIALVITIHPEWLEKVSLEYKNIYRILTEFNQGSNPYQALYQGKIDRNIHRNLRKVYSSPKQDFCIFDGVLRMNMATMLKHYDKLLDNYWLAIDIRNFIIKHLTDENLGLDMLCDCLRLSKRVLRYQFNHTFGQNIITYVHEKRIELAKEIMQNKQYNITDIYFKVGYKDESTFRYHYNRFNSTK